MERKETRRQLPGEQLSVFQNKVDRYHDNNISGKSR
jgi:hypothetical protein